MFRVSGVVFRVWGLGLEDSGFGIPSEVARLGIRVSGFRITGFGFRDSKFRVRDYEIRDSGFGIRVQGPP